MCGIAGFISQNSSEANAEKLIQQMLKSIAHRGPDARGIWMNAPVFLGHNRLSIIDLSKDGNQPMEYFDSVITYNGEIYNYIEVREQLIKLGYSFKTKSDTEVILAAYREYGKQCVHHFVGMWAFAIWDKKEELLFCSRDRFGIKPFYYLHEVEQFYFGSEYKALKSSPLFSDDLNLAQVARGLQLGWVCYEEETYYTGLKSLPASHNLIFSKGRVIIEKYWDIDFNKRYSGTVEQKKQEFLKLFEDSIRLHMRSDVEVGACLSGGLDSSAIASAISVYFPEAKPKTFTIYYEGKDSVDERPFVQEVLKKYPALEPNYFSPSDRQIEESFEKAVYHADVPITSSSPLSQYFVMQLASEKNIKVVIDGQGADEYLGGYLHSFYRLIGGLMRNFKWMNAHREFYAHVNHQQFSSRKSADVFMKSILSGVFSEQFLYSYEYKNYLPFLGNDSRPVFNLQKKETSKLNNFLYQLMFSTLLPTLLQFEDRNSMAFSIESRVPFLDHRLVEFVFSLPDEDKVQLGITKNIMRKSLSGILPEAISNRKDKKGFVTPGEIKWLRGPLRFLIEQDFKNIDFINQTLTQQIIRDFKTGSNKNANLVWRLALLNYWRNQ